MASATPSQTIFRAGPASQVAIGAVSTASVAFSASCRAVRLVATSACRITFALAPTAIATDALLIANVPEEFIVSPGDKVAVLQDVAAGVLSVLELQS